jgi:hypothetical protein
MKKYLALILSGAVFIFLAASAYYFVVQKPKVQLAEYEAEKTSLELQAATKEQNKINKLEACLLEADKNRYDRWLANCEDFGSYHKKNDDGEITNCALPTYLIDIIEEEQQSEKDRCVEIYK